MLPQRSSQRFVVHLYFQFHFPSVVSQTCSLLPSNRNRSTVVHALVTAFDLLRSPPSEVSYVVSLLRPSPACGSDLTAYHDRCYVDALLADPPGTDYMNRNEFGLEGVRAILIAYPFVITIHCRTARLFLASENTSSE